MVPLLPRNARGRVQDLLATFRVVVVGGARQVGKTTLVEEFLDLPAPSRFTFDDEATLERAMEDPVGFVASLPRPAAVDEFQRAGRGFLLAVKRMVDRDRARGQLLLTGSASYLADRSISETLAGRAGRVELWPLSTGERRRTVETFVDHLFDPSAWPPPAPTWLARDALVAELLSGGYPELVSERMGGAARRTWFEAYVRDTVSREALRPLAEVRLEAELRTVLRLLAARTAQELVITDLAADAGLARETAANYVTLLEALHLVVLVPAWATSATTRAKRRPKVLLLDTALAADLCGAEESAFGPRADGRVAGALFETLVATEVHKQLAWCTASVGLAHFRDRNGPEVDLIVEDRRSGAVAGVEAKLTASPRAADARHLALLRDRLGDRFRVGLVVHAGEQALNLGDRLWAVPVSALWRDDAPRGPVRG